VLPLSAIPYSLFPIPSEVTTRAPVRRPPVPPRAEPVPGPRSVRIPVFLLVSLAAVLAATLTPSAEQGALGWDACILCGDRGLADALLNVALFLPLGAALARLRVTPMRAVAACAALSAAVELAQMVIPGRDPAPPDLLFNTLGAALGYAIGTRMDALLRPSPRAAGRLAIGWSAAFAAVVAATGWLTAPAPPAGTYVGQWTPELRDYPDLPAHVLDVRVGGIHVPRGRFGPEADVRRVLARGEPLEIQWVVGWRIEAPAPLLRIVGRGGDEALAVFIDREDAVFYRRTRAAALRLDRPTIGAARVIGAIAPGDTVRLTLRLRGRRAHVVTDAGLSVDDGWGPGRGWALLLSQPGRSHRRALFLDALWTAVWMAPLGLWLRRRPASLAALAIASAALLILPAAVALAPAGVSEIVGALAGLGAGAALHRIRRPHRRTRACLTS
jgi:hypothetical protein